MSDLTVKECTSRAGKASWAKLTPEQRLERVRKAGMGNKGRKQSPEHLSKRLAACAAARANKAK